MLSVNVHHWANLRFGTERKQETFSPKNNFYALMNLKKVKIQWHIKMGTILFIIINTKRRNEHPNYIDYVINIKWL
jgi:hypothetical protein